MGLIRAGPALCDSLSTARPGSYDIKAVPVCKTIWKSLLQLQLCQLSRNSCRHTVDLYSNSIVWIMMSSQSSSLGQLQFHI